MPYRIVAEDLAAPSRKQRTIGNETNLPFLDIVLALIGAFDEEKRASRSRSVPIEHRRRDHRRTYRPNRYRARKRRAKKSFVTVPGLPCTVCNAEGSVFSDAHGNSRDQSTIGRIIIAALTHDVRVLRKTLSNISSIFPKLFRPGRDHFLIPPSGPPRAPL